MGKVPSRHIDGIKHLVKREEEEARKGSFLLGRRGGRFQNLKPDIKDTRQIPDFSQRKRDTLLAVLSSIKDFLGPNLQSASRRREKKKKGPSRALL